LGKGRITTEKRETPSSGGKGASSRKGETVHAKQNTNSKKGEGEGSSKEEIFQLELQRS